MSNPSQLLLLADHIKLSLLERQRAKSLNLDSGSDSQDGHVSRSLDQLRSGLASLEQERERLEQAGDDRFVLAHPRLRYTNEEPDKSSNVSLTTE